MSVQLPKKEYSENNYTLRILTPVDNQIVQIVKEKRLYHNLILEL
jgi:hypothetical protein